MPIFAALALFATEAVAKPHVPLLSTPDLGKAEGHCRPNEEGPALLVDITGFKDRKGRIKVEVYPASDPDFLMDDNVLVYQGKTFRRTEEEVPQSGPVSLCVRVPGPGNYALMVLHDRDSNRKLNVGSDGIGFGSNPNLHFRKPHAREATIAAGPGITHVPIIMSYWSGLGFWRLSSH